MLPKLDAARIKHELEQKSSSGYELSNTILEIIQRAIARRKPLKKAK